MKKNFWICLMCVCFLGVLSGCGNKETLKIYLPGEYMSDQLVPDFEKEYNCNVEVELFDSNEMMYTKISAGDVYDVLIPSDYMIQRLMNEDYLEELDMSKLSNYSEITSTLLSAPYNNYDPSNSYSVPYFWGSVGIVYDKTAVSEDDIKAEGYEIFKDTNYKDNLYMYDSERDAFMVAFKALGYSMNTNDEAEINAAYEWLVEMNKTMNPIFVTDEVIDNMAQGRKALALVYSGDAAYILSENEDMSYYAPECGTNVWVDAMVIPKNAENKELAYKFIDFVISYDEAYANTEEIGYASVRQDILDEVTAEDGIYYDNEAYLPRAGYDKDEVFNDDEFLRKKLSELLIKVKASN